MSELDLIKERIKKQDAFIDFIRAKLIAYEVVLKNHIPNFEQQYARELALEVERQKKKADRSDGYHNAP